MAAAQLAPSSLRDVQPGAVHAHSLWDGEAVRGVVPGLADGQCLAADLGCLLGLEGPCVGIGQVLGTAGKPLRSPAGTRCPCPFGTIETRALTQRHGARAQREKRGHRWWTERVCFPEPVACLLVREQRIPHEAGGSGQACAGPCLPGAVEANPVALAVDHGVGCGTWGCGHTLCTARLFARICSCASAEPS